MQVKNIMAKTLAPVAQKAAKKSGDFWCPGIFGMRKLPKKLMRSVK